jgi:hypothetical protein
MMTETEYLEALNKATNGAMVKEELIVDRAILKLR